MHSSQKAYDDFVANLEIGFEAVEVTLKVGDKFDVNEHAGLHMIEADCMWKNLLVLEPNGMRGVVRTPTILVQAHVCALNHFHGQTRGPNWDNPGRSHCRVVWLDERGVVLFIWVGNYMVVTAQMMSQLATDENCE